MRIVTSFIFVCLILLASSVLANTTKIPIKPFHSIYQQFELAEKKIEVKSIKKFLEPEKIYLIHFFATWCLPCLDELPKLIDNVGKLEPHNLNLILISVDFQDTANVYKILHNKKIGLQNLTFYHDKDQNLFKQFNFKHLPSSVIMRGDGVCLARANGQVNWSSEKVDINIGQIIIER